jgi:amidohydrolase
MLSALVDLRKEIHQHPELSGCEVQTAERLKRFITDHSPATFITGLGGNGLAAIYDFGAPGPTIMFRCELDALPIEEVNQFEYRSVNPGISHKCGHDGHMAILAGLIFKIKEHDFKKGKIILLFQPAEENGQGAEAVLKDERFKDIQPDFVFALHNLPGKEMNSIIVKDEVFTATVQSLAIHLTGKVAHASEPENGINPAAAIAGIIDSFAKLNITATTDKDFRLLTPICIRMGEIAYGVSAGQAEIHYTLRTWSEENMEALEQSLIDIIETTCKKHNLYFSVDWFDYFPATVNNRNCVEIIREAARQNNFTLEENDVPIRFGEDFGWFSQQYKTAMFGLGSGINTPALHHHDYDFPDEIIETGVRMFESIARELLT